MLRRGPLLALLAVCSALFAGASSSLSATVLTPPRSPLATGVTGTTIAVSWLPPLGWSPRGYALYLNGAKVAAVSWTQQYRFSGLSCGRQYRVAVDAYDLFQNHSLQATLVASTASCLPPPPPPPPPPPSLPAPQLPASAVPTPGPGSPGVEAVSPSGSDANVCSTTAPCASFDRAFHVARPGDVVLVAGGTYPAQSLTRDASKVGVSQDVTFRSAPGALAVVNGFSLDGVEHVRLIGSSSGDLKPATSGITLRSTPAAMDTGADLVISDCSRYVTVQGIDMRQFGITGSDHVTISGGTVGGYDDTTSDSYVSGPYQGRGSSFCTAENPYAVVISGVLFHDVLRTNAPAAHPDCLQFYGTAGATVDGNQFVRCGTSDVMARPATDIWTGNNLDSLVLRNNSFTPAVEGSQEVVIGASPDACGSVSFLGNDAGVDGGLSSFACGSYTSLVVEGNHFGWFSRYSCQMALAEANVTFDSNVFRTAPLCGSNAQLG